MKSEEEIRRELGCTRNNYRKHKNNESFKSYLEGYITALEWVLSNEKIED